MPVSRLQTVRRVWVVCGWVSGRICWYAVCRIARVRKPWSGCVGVYLCAWLAMRPSVCVLGGAGRLRAGLPRAACAVLVRCALDVFVGGACWRVVYASMCPGLVCRVCVARARASHRDQSSVRPRAAKSRSCEPARPREGAVEEAGGCDERVPRGLEWGCCAPLEGGLRGAKGNSRVWS